MRLRWRRNHTVIVSRAVRHHHQGIISNWTKKKRKRRSKEIRSRSKPGVSFSNNNNPRRRYPSHNEVIVLVIITHGFTRLFEWHFSWHGHHSLFSQLSKPVTRVISLRTCRSWTASIHPTLPYRLLSRLQHHPNRQPISPNQCLLRTQSS